jgi:hypothetical protein
VSNTLAINGKKIESGGFFSFFETLLACSLETLIMTFLLNVYFEVLVADVFVTVSSPVSTKSKSVYLLPAISYRRCCVTGDKLIAGAMKLMKIWDKA